MKILITGHKGMLGSLLLKRIQKEHEVIGYDLPEVDLTNESALLEKVANDSPDFIFHCAAFTNVDLCETEKDKAFAVNALSVQYLANGAKALNIPILHISTDYVFDGQGTEPYLPEHPRAPISVYGQTKAEGERLLEQSGAYYYIVRTAWLYGPNGKNFVETILQLAKTKPELKVVNDQKGAPTYTGDLVDCLVRFLAKPPQGIYHFTNGGACTWYRFAIEILCQSGIKTPIKPCTTAEFPRPAQRPAYSVLNLEKTAKTFDLTIPLWQDGLAKYLQARE